MSLIDTLGELVAKLPAAAIKLLVDLVREALTSDDPTRLIERRLAARASEEGAEAAIDAGLERLRKP